ncbi:BTAD domain-containing putative transcriptional regulator [Actinophytocola sp.]|uniref:AfsR/SARP family transcriptional regulator n=1 Tax=Actinophytocola sp. TaxID=1872138 RepID=UPI00389AECFA
MRAELRLFGEVTAVVDGRVVHLGPARQRCVLAVLAVEPNQLVPLTQLAGRVWGEDAPHRPTETLRSYLSRLRTVLSALDVGVHRRPGGYVLVVDEDVVDLHRFRGLVARARRADDVHAVTLYDKALALWRGEPFAGLESPWLAGVRDALTGEYLAARLDHHDVRLRRGQHAELTPDLLALAAEYPWDERLAAQVMLALYGGGRQAGALSFYDDLRVRLGEELGVDPGAELRDLHQRILRADPVLRPAPPPAAVPGRPVPRQLPAAPSGFTGRARELAELDHADRAARVSVLAGVGGVGKTWLALRWAHDNATRFPDGQLFANLRGFDPRDEPVAPETVLRAFVAALGVPAASMPATRDELAGLFRSLVADRRVLVVLDNARDSAQVAPLLPGGAGCSVVVTSRNRLSGTMSSTGARSVILDVLSPADARQVLVAQLGADRVAAGGDAVDELLTCCAGLPLALGIVAARANTEPGFPLSAFAAELRPAATRLDMLGDETAGLRHVLSWSYRALSPAAATLFARLGALPGPVFGEAAAASAGGVPLEEVRVPLRELAGAHLVAEYEPGRYRMHDLVRLYATELATEHGDAPLRRVLDHYLRTAYAAALRLKPHRQPLALPEFDDLAVLVPLSSAAEAMAWFVRESPSLVAAVVAAEANGFGVHAWQLAWAMTDFFERHGHWRDYIATNHVALTAAVQLDDLVAQARTHRTLGRAYLFTGEHGPSLDHQERAAVLYERSGDLVSFAHAHIGIGNVYVRQNDYRRALSHARRSLDVFRELGHRAGQASALNAVGWCEAQLGMLADAEAHCRSALGLHHELADRHGEAGAWDSIGYVLMRASRHEEAVACFVESVALARDLRDRASEGEALDHLGDAHEAMGDRETARKYWQEALSVLEELDPAAAAGLRGKVSAAG